MILKVDFALKLIIIHHQMNPKKFPTILHSQFNYHTLPVTTFNSFHLSALLFLECRVWLLSSENEVIWSPKYLYTTISSYFWLIYLFKMLSLLYIPRFHLFHYARHIFSRLRTFHCVCSHLYAAAHSSFIFHSVYTYPSLHKVTTDFWPTHINSRFLENSETH